jgi:hypothetical protein
MNTLNSISLGELYKQMFKATIRLLIIIHGVPKNNFPNDSLNFILFLNVQIITLTSKCSLTGPSHPRKSLVLVFLLFANVIDLEYDVRSIDFQLKINVFTIKIVLFNDQI